MNKSSQRVLRIGSTSLNVQPVQPMMNYRETTARVFHGTDDPLNTNGGRVLYCQTGVQIAVKEEDSLTEETKINGMVTGVGICVLYNPEIPFNKNTQLYYIGVSKLEICCPASVEWVFDWASCLPHLKYVRFGRGFFLESKIFTPIMKKIEESPSVEELEITFNEAGFDNQDAFERQHTINKLKMILDFSATYFIGLTRVNFIMPDISDLHLFEKNANPVIRSTALKCPISSGNMVHYFTVNENIRWIKKDQQNDEVPHKRIKLDEKPGPEPKLELTPVPKPTEFKPEPKPPVETVDLTGEDEVDLTGDDYGVSSTS